MLLTRIFLLVASTVVCTAAQGYPTIPIRAITAGVGGGTDLASKLIASGVARPPGQQIIVENRRGGNETGYGKDGQSHQGCRDA